MMMVHLDHNPLLLFSIVLYNDYVQYNVIMIDVMIDVMIMIKVMMIKVMMISYYDTMT